MFGLDFLDLVIGLFVVYFVFAVMASALTEVVASALGMRSKNLMEGIRIMFQDDERAMEAFYDHAAIKALAPPGKKPSYIPSDVVARVYTALTDVADAVDAKISQRTQERIAEATHVLVGDEIERVRTLFDNTMDRAVGWYKRKTQLIILIIAIFSVTVANADTIMMVNSLWQDPTARDQLVAIAERQPAPDETQSDEEALRESVETRESVESLGILGWESRDDDAETQSPRAVPDWPTDVDTLLPWITKVVGLGVTVGAVSMGAPFWYSMLGKLLNARMGLVGRKPDTDERQ